MAFDFKSWTFERNGQKIPMSSIIDETEVFLIKNCPKPILTRTCISKIMTSQKLREVDFTLWNTQATGTKHGIIVACKITIEDEINGKKFCGNGEASLANTEGLSSDYLVAMAIKRARSRAIIDYLAIDAFGEDEAPSFNIQKIEDLSDDIIKRIGIIETKKNISEYIKELASRRKNKLSIEELRKFIKWCLGINEEEKIKLNDIQIDDLFKIIVALHIDEFFEDDGSILNEYIKRSSNPTK